MGAWGPKLYEDDIALDVKEYYNAQLQKGRTNQEITDEIMDTYSEEIEDADDGPVFWFALADCQWKMGRLLPEVKEMALKHISTGNNLKRWKEEASEKDYLKRKIALDELEKKLLSPMPPEKRIKIPKLFKCEWKIGDVYAYKFTSEDSKENGFYSKYVAFRKIEEREMWPGHIIPVVNIFNRVWNYLPDLKELKSQDYLPMAYINYNNPSSYKIELLTKSKSAIPENNLFYLGNLINITLPINENRTSDKVSYEGVWWKDFEQKLIIDFRAYEEKKEFHKIRMTKKGLIKSLNEEKIPEELYSLDGELKDKSLCLEVADNGWRTFLYFSGKRYQEKVFTIEADAYEYIYYKIKDFAKELSNKK